MKRFYKHLILSAAFFCLFAAVCGAQVKVKSWTLTSMDGSRTGAASPSIEDVDVKLGTVRDGNYHAPNGKVYSRGSATAKVASHLIGVQPQMAPVKVVIGTSTREMVAEAPESELSNWFIDTIMEKVEKLSGKKVDFGVGNFGGIRTSMPKDTVILDDLMSMFPFRNQVVYLELQGREIRAVLDSMLTRRIQVLGGCRIVAKGNRLVSAEIAGAPLDDDRWYSVATISFLLDGGDKLYLADKARNLIRYPVNIIDVMLEKVNSLTAAGQSVEYHTDGRVKLLQEDAQYE